MSKTIHDAAYKEFPIWLKAERARRNAETGGKCTMRALAPRLMWLLGRTKLKFCWVAKIEQKDRRIDLLEYAAYCIALGVDPHEGLRRVVDRLEEGRGTIRYPRRARQPAAQAAEPPAEKHKKQVKTARFFTRRGSLPKHLFAACLPVVKAADPLPLRKFLKSP